MSPIAAIKDENDNLHTYVCCRGGSRSFRKILIACNGLAAIKFIKSIRLWSFQWFGSGDAIQLIAMCSADDNDNYSRFIDLAGGLKLVVSGKSHLNYGNVDLVVQIAMEHKVDAVWAGWGHASENPLLPKELQRVGIKFIGPSSESMKNLGDKVSSTIIAQSAGVNCIFWSGDGIKIDLPESQVAVVDNEVYARACIDNIDTLKRVASSIGYPLMIKASEGGGGKGIRIVNNEKDLEASYEMVKKEVIGSPIFAMKVCSDSRHLEMQLIGDEHGNYTVLYGRDCTIQRRHQKIFEEAPIVIASDQCLQKMEESAVRLAKCVQYFNAGTVEFLYRPQTDEFFFLELNPRLQVEHPASELACDVNIPAIQVQIAMGIPLFNIPDLRKFYSHGPDGIGEFDMSLNNRCRPKCHVIAARITAENPAQGFRPNTGSVQELELITSPDVWGYFSVGHGSSLHEFGDSQFGHLFARGSNREMARINLKVALCDLKIRGTFVCTKEKLMELLDKEEFKSMDYDTRWLDSLILNGDLESSAILNNTDVALCVSAYQSLMQHNDYLKLMLETFKKGLVPRKNLFLLDNVVNFFYNGMEFKAITHFIPQFNIVSVIINGVEVQVEVFQEKSDSGLIVCYNGGKHSIFCWSAGPLQDRYLIDDSTCLVKRSSDDSILGSPSPGKLLKYRVNDGDTVSKGQVICELEVMKMCLDISATKSGVISLCSTPGTILKCGSTIAKILSTEATKQTKYTLFEDKPAMEPVGSMDPFSLGLSIIEQLEIQILCRKPIEADIRTMVMGLQNHADTKNFLEHLRSDKIKDIDSYHKSLTNKVLGASRTERLLNLVETVCKSEEMAPPFKSIAHECAILMLQAPLDRVLGYCLKFDCYGSLEEACKELRKESTDHKNVYSYLHFYYSIEDRSTAVNYLINTIIETFPRSNENAQLVELLRKLADLKSPALSKISRKCKQLLFQWQLPSLHDLYKRMESKFDSALENGGHKEISDKRNFIEDMVRGFSTHLDVLPRFFQHPNVMISQLALEIYIRRISESYALCSICPLRDIQGSLMWTFGSNIPSISFTDRESIWSPGYSVAGDVVDPDGSYEELRGGIIVNINGHNNIDIRLKECCCKLKKEGTVRNVLYLIVSLETQTETQESCIVNEFTGLVSAAIEELTVAGVSRLTLVVMRNSFPSLGFYTWRKSLNYEEDRTIRHLDPSMAYLLEFNRLSNYDIAFSHADPTGQIHIYHGKAKTGGSSNDRLFARLVIRPNQVMRHFNSIDELFQETFRIFEETFDSVEAVLSSSVNPSPLSNHLFLNVLPVFVNTSSQVNDVIRIIMDRYDRRIKKLHFRQGEVKMNLATARGAPPTRHRFLLSNETGHRLDIQTFYEERDPISGRYVLCSLNKAKLQPSFDLIPSSTPYPSTFEPIQLKRYRVQSTMGTTYIYDFPALFEKAISSLLPNAEILFEEGFFESNPRQFVFKQRPVGQNTCGMVVWRCSILLHKAIRGQFVIIGNDIDFEIGSFGLQEDELFHAASKFARNERLPRIYLSANSGARIGLAEEVLNVFRVAWIDESEPKKGFRYLYLQGDDFEHLPSRNCVNVEKIIVGDDVHYKIIDIIGAKDGIGVENLQGSALIAGETSLAYDTSFTVTLVTGRSVGIGAYLVRLGQRAVQRSDQPIILTGFAALNSILGRDVYQNNLQLGGPHVMSTNGVSHLVVNDDWEGVQEVVRWLFYLPTLNKLLPTEALKDTDLMRAVDVEWHSSPESDPRDLLTGTSDNRLGILDKGSFREYLVDWAPGVVVGRGRLGGLSVGVIATETRTTVRQIPADPANPDSCQIEYPQAGQVWFPDSAFKTATALKDFSREQLPVLIIANWRGFSGGQRDLFQEVLKFGAMIVEALSVYQLPVTVYIPPKGELRGGSWVVIDSKINPGGMIEMYADPTSRGGILEPEGLVGVKIKARHHDNLMKRLLNETDSSRKKQLESVFHQIAVHFADLHDTPGRMLSKGVIRGIVELKDVRRKIGLRIARRMIEVQNRIKFVDMEAAGFNEKDSSDMEFVNFYSKNQRLVDSFSQARIREERKQELLAELAKL